MRILIINPNSTTSMTRAIAEAARAVAAPGTIISDCNPETGPPSIQGPEDGAAALPGLFALFDRKMSGPELYDATIIACFDDTGLGSLKDRSPVPVVGIGEAAYHAAMLVGKRFSVVTTLGVSVPVIENNIRRYGFAARCARVRASGVPVLDLDNAKVPAAERIATEIGHAVREDGCDAIVLGCAGMADLAQAMTRRFELPVVDGVTAAVTLCQALHHAGIGNSRIPRPDAAAS